MPKFKISSYGQGLGDCFLIEISNDISSINIIIDGHRKLYDSLKQKIKNNDIKKIDYLVITHTDVDHIQGMIQLLEDEDLKERLKNTKIIYNYVSKPLINYEHAENFEGLILDKKIIHTCNNHYIQESNTFFKILSLKKRTEFTPPSDECVYMTLLHPHKKEEVDEVYRDYCKKKEDGKKTPNSKLVNKYSIALMIEFKGKTALFTGDSNMSILNEKVNNFKNIKNKKIDIIKIPHHGAKTENVDLLDFAIEYKCSEFIITGQENWQGVHPNRELLNKMDEKIIEMKIYTNIKGLPESRNILYKPSSEIKLI